MQILLNARILTQNVHQPRAEALAIENGRIIAVGKNEDILSILRKEKKIVDLHQAAILPGLCESHIHLGQYSQALSKIDCDTATREACLQRVALAAQSAEPGSWLLGHGWDQNQWPEGYGSASQLDSISTQHPIYLTIKSLHAAWANSLAMQLAGIDQNTPDPAGGTILRNADGTPTGILLESAALLVEKIIPQPSTASMAAMLQQGQAHLWQMGITSAHDFDGSGTFLGLQSLHLDKKLKLRILKHIRLEQFEAIKTLGIQPGFGDAMLTIGSLKLFMDGAIGPHTAAMLEPFTNSSSCGELLYEDAELFDLYRDAREHGFAIAMHAIGDLANHKLLNTIEKIRQLETTQHLPWLRYRIEHAQLIQPDDVPRFKTLQVIASMQPIHLPMDIHTTETALAGRGDRSFLFRSLMDHQVPLAFGSDAPVADPNPFLGLHAAVTRQNPENQLSWHPQECLTLSEALSAYTIHPAYAAGWENCYGKLQAGFHADLIVLPSDITTLSVDQLKTCLPQATMVDGEWVFSTLPELNNA